MGQDCASERVPIGLAEADQRPPGPLRGGRWGCRKNTPPMSVRGADFPAECDAEAAMTNGAYLQVFDVKSRRGLCAVPSGAPPRKCSKGYFRALSAWRESALGAFRPLRRAFAARSLYARQDTWKERAARRRTAIRLTLRRDLNSFFDGTRDFGSRLFGVFPRPKRQRDERSLVLAADAEAVARRWEASSA